VSANGKPATDTAKPHRSGGIWGAGHPVRAVLDQAMLDQPTLTLMCTFQREERVAQHGAHRVMRMPIAENAMLGMAVGMAMTGRRVVCDLSRVAFLYSAMDPLVNQATKWSYSSNGQFSVPLLIEAITQGGENLGSQHEHVPHAALSQVPGLVVAVPGSPNSAAGLIATALTYPDPVVVLESPRLFMPGWSDEPETEPNADPIPFGVAHQARSGDDVTLVGIGNSVAVCLRAADELAERGYGCQVIDLRTAAPLDREGVAELSAGTGGVVLVDEAPAPCSLVRDLGYHLITSGAVAPDRVRTVSGALCPMPASPTLQRALIPDPDRVVDTALALLAPALH
jgi:pyruvate/2-oxoglutarate/acetoin dehydrogenase E1 component